VLPFRGSVVALDAATGKILWKTYMIDEVAIPTTKSKTGAQMKGPSGAAVWSTPTIDVSLGRLYVGTGNNYSDPPTSRSDAVVALDLKTGGIVWEKQFVGKDAYNSSCDLPEKPNCPASDGPDYDFGQPPILVSLPGGQRALVIGQKSGDVRALAPDREGAVLWETKVGPGGKLGGVHWGSASDGRHVYVALGGQSMRFMPDSTLAEKFRMEPDPAQGGGLFALDLATGKQVWKAPPIACTTRPLCSPAQSAPVTAIAGAVFSGSLDGHLRAYSATSGAVLWDFDTIREFDVVNDGKARGGALDVAGPVVAGKMVFVMSGYGLFRAAPGNVLLALTVR
jgi:polyvinyl alcohol dehydrogenase (cytochrome)